MSAPAFLLLAYSLRRLRTLVITTGILLGVFQVVLVAVAGSIEKSGSFEALSALLPPFVRELLGPSLTSFMSFSGIVCAGYFHVAVMGALIGLTLSVATIPVSEIETGFIDLILSRPLARHWIITRTIGATMLAIVLPLVLMTTGTMTGLYLLAPAGAGWPPMKLILSLALNLGLLTLCWGGVTLAIASVSRRRSEAGALAGLLALASFFIDYVGRLWRPAESIAWLSPFRYFAPFDLVMGNPLPTRNLVVLGGIAVAGFTAAYILFARRDIAR
jgi:ABC-2 type transport system permease protein